MTNSENTFVLGSPVTWDVVHIVITCMTAAGSSSNATYTQHHSLSTQGIVLHAAVLHAPQNQWQLPPTAHLLQLLRRGRTARVHVLAPASPAMAAATAAGAELPPLSLLSLSLSSPLPPLSSVVSSSSSESATLSPSPSLLSPSSSGSPACSCSYVARSQALAPASMFFLSSGAMVVSLFLRTEAQ
jgi:hypothetical protein